MNLRCDYLRLHEDILANAKTFAIARRKHCDHDDDDGDDDDDDNDDDDDDDDDGGDDDDDDDEFCCEFGTRVVSDVVVNLAREL